MKPTKKLNKRGNVSVSENIAIQREIRISKGRQISSASKLLAK